MFSSLFNRSRAQEHPEDSQKKSKARSHSSPHVVKANSASALFRSITRPQIPRITEEEAKYVQSLSPEERKAYLAKRDSL